MGFLTSSAALTANSTFTSRTLLSDRADKISGAVFADQTGTLFIEQSADGTNWDISKSVAITASTGTPFSEDLLLPFIRVRYTNGGTNQGVFRVTARYTSAGDS